MALVKYSNIVDQVSGKIGSVQYYDTRYGGTIKTITIVKNPKTLAQQTVRNAFAIAAKTWSTLSPVVQGNWKTYANTLTKNQRVGGGTYSPTPADVFVGLAVIYQYLNPGLGLGSLNVPVGTFTGDTVVITITGTLINRIDFAASANQHAGVKTIFKYQQRRSTTSTPAASNYKLGPIFAVSNGFNNGITGLQPGTYAVAYQFAEISTGRTTPLVSLGDVDVS